MMFSSVINTADPSSSNPTHHHQHQHQRLQVPSYSDVFSDHHPNLVPGMVAQDAQQPDHVFIESTDPFISAYGNTTMDNQHGSVARVTKKKSDKRSKIRTSQGLRDRRVRLSIEIARKFFDLQDLLGFDKPSRTVEWLLTKSKKAILELSGASSSTISEAAVTEDCFKSSSPYRRTAICTNSQIQVSSDDSLKTMKRKEALLTRESRERARARARARTLAKLCTSKFHHQEIRLQDCHNFGSPSLSKTSYAKMQEESARKEEEKPCKQKQQLQLHSYVPNPNCAQDWGISSVIPLQGSSTTNRLNLSTDVEIYTRSTWDQLLLHNCRNL